MSDNDYTMTHFSTAYFGFEGMKEGTVHYRCRYCLQHIYVQFAQRPENLHACPLRQPQGDTATPAYVSQGD